MLLSDPDILRLTEHRHADNIVRLTGLWVKRGSQTSLAFSLLEIAEFQVNHP